MDALNTPLAIPLWMTHQGITFQSTNNGRCFSLARMYELKSEGTYLSLVELFGRDRTPSRYKKVWYEGNDADLCKAIILELLR